LEHRRRKLRPQTLDKYGRMIENHLTDGIGRCPVARLDVAKINTFLDEKALHGRLDGRGGLSAGYLKILRYVLISALEFISKQAPCPALSEEIFSMKVKKSDCRILTTTEQRRLESLIYQGVDGTRLGILLCLHTGCASAKSAVSVERRRF
jgi:hypothetical protein